MDNDIKHKDYNTAGTDLPHRLTSHISMMPFVVAVFGTILTLGIYIFTTFFTNNIVREEYETITAKTTEVLIDGIADIKSTLALTASLMDADPILKERPFNPRLQDTIPNLQAFEKLYLYERGPEGWQRRLMYRNTVFYSEEALETTDIGAEEFAMILRTDPFARLQPVFISNLPGLNQRRNSVLSRDILYKPIVAVVPIAKGAPQQGLIVGLTNLSTVLDMPWLNDVPYLSSMTVTDVQSGELLFNVEARNEDHGFGGPIEQTYSLNTGQEEWEVTTEIYKYERLLLMEYIAPLIMTLGLVLTAIATLYVRNHYLKSNELAQMYQTLEQKNLDLEHEVREKADIYDALKKSESENRAIIDSVSDIIFEADKKGNLLFISAAWQKVTGFSIKQSIGSNLFSLLNPEDQNQQRKDFELLSAGEKEPYRSFTKLRTSKGRFRAVELAFSMIRRDVQGNTRVVGTLTDIEDRRKAERALGEAEKKYRTIVENAPSGIYQLTPEGVYLSANPALARILGYDSPEEILNNVKNANQSVYVDARQRIQFMRDLEDEATISNHEAQVFKKDGSKIWINENARVVYDDNGNVLYYEGSIEDITERKAQEEALHKAKIISDLSSRAKSEFLANMSHELRTPLNSIIGFSEIITSETYGEIEQPEYLEYAHNIHDSGRNLLEIINEILDISKIEAGERELNETRVDIPKVVQSCLDLLSNKIESNKMEISNMLHGMPKILAEELAIKQIAMNLISNAVKFTPSGGRLTLSYEVEQNGELKLSFTDTGIGLDDSEIEKALSPFGQIDSEFSRNNSGTGLGLTLVDSLIALHGGRLEIFSQKGIGTTASLVFPVERVTIPKDQETSPA